MVIVVFRARSRPDLPEATIVEFESHETAAAWRDHPEHRATQAFGRERVFSEYHIQVCDLVRESRFP